MAGSSSGLGSSTASVGSTMPGSVANGSAVGSAGGKRGTSAVGGVVAGNEVAGLVAGNEVAGLVAGIEVAGLVTGCASLTLAVITFAVGGVVVDTFADGGVVADTVAVSGRPTAGAGNADGAAVVVFAVGAFGDISGVAGGKPFAGVPVVAGGKAFAGVPAVGGVVDGIAGGGVATVPGSAGTVGAGVACTVCVFTCSATRR